MPSYSTPLKLGPLLLKNRVIMASLTRDRNRIPGPLQVEYYTQRAGAGLILTEGTFIEELGCEWSNAPGIYTNEQVAGWKKIVDSVHARQGLIYIQLWHIGRVAHPLLQNGRPNVGPSALAAKGGKFSQIKGEPGYVVPEAIKDPTFYISLYKQAAERAKEAGFDGVELHREKYFFPHSANGYLPHQFIDNTSNHRTEQWGGSVENRCRFPLGIIDELSRVYGNDRVGIKLSPSGGYNDIGMNDTDTIETYGYLIKELNARRLAYIQLARYWAFVDPAGRGKNVDIFQWRKLINSEHTAFFVNTDFDSEEGAKVLESGMADAIVFGRLYISNPDLAERLIKNRELNTYLNMQGLCGGGREGYTNYPTYEKQKLQQFLSNIEYL
ncbi:unnamed protein product [Rotaria sordida]|uniref:NADH:flavin oxidoreductase/NADH oxidase N-terminal domain-containing protein n=1 Tax=Rotaria sordida TaxID=392033 RepID=A0A818IF23_9BILA|nr:unnamed protein product [Rotaria sordida]CAF3551322.1 unnamed protein product [Rotaria sordida]